MQQQQSLTTLVQTASLPQVGHVHTRTRRQPEQSSGRSQWCDERRVGMALVREPQPWPAGQPSVGRGPSPHGRLGIAGCLRTRSVPLGRTGPQPQLTCRAVPNGWVATNLGTVRKCASRIIGHPRILQRVVPVPLARHGHGPGRPSGSGWSSTGHHGGWKPCSFTRQPDADKSLSRGCCLLACPGYQAMQEVVRFTFHKSWTGPHSGWPPV